MDREEIIATLKELSGPILKNDNLELVDLDCFHQGKGLIIRLIVDKPEGGVTVGECARLNKELGEILDKDEAFVEIFALEVFSPGLDRPLKTKEDFMRVSNREIEVVLGEPILDKKGLTGSLRQVFDDKIQLDINGELIDIFFSNIIHARQKV